jgi:hypothetical protein
MQLITSVVGMILLSGILMTWAFVIFIFTILTAIRDIKKGDIHLSLLALIIAGLFATFIFGQASLFLFEFGMMMWETLKNGGY